MEGKQSSKEQETVEVSGKCKLVKEKKKGFRGLSAALRQQTWGLFPAHLRDPHSLTGAMRVLFSLR